MRNKIQNILRQSFEVFKDKNNFRDFCSYDIEDIISKEDIDAIIRAYKRHGVICFASISGNKSQYSRVSLYFDIARSNYKNSIKKEDKNENMGR